MTYYRFIVLAACSTEEQSAEDKDTIPRQLANARKYGERMGGEWVTVTGDEVEVRFR